MGQIRSYRDESSFNGTWELVKATKRDRSRGSETDQSVFYEFKKDDKRVLLKVGRFGMLDLLDHAVVLSSDPDSEKSCNFETMDPGKDNLGMYETTNKSREEKNETPKSGVWIELGSTDDDPIWLPEELAKYEKHLQIKRARSTDICCSLNLKAVKRGAMNRFQFQIKVELQG